MTSPTTAPADLRTMAIDPLADLFRGLLRWELWSRLGWLEVKRRYRRTVIGPFWSTISLLILVVALGSVGSGLLTQETSSYVPFVATGMILWFMVSTMLNEAGTVFSAGAGLLRQKQFEYSVLIYALLWRNLVVTCHNMAVYVLVVLFYDPVLFISRIILCAIPGVALLLLNMTWLVLLLGMVSLRFRDIQQVVQTLLQISLFVTPIFWMPDNLRGIRRVLFVELNPLHHLIAIVREPLLGELPHLNSYIAVGLITIAGWSFTYVIFHRFRNRLPYWL